MPRAGFAYPVNLAEWLAQATAPLREAPFTHEIVLAAQQQPLPHRDPADRFLAATAQVMDLTFVTSDDLAAGHRNHPDHEKLRTQAEARRCPTVMGTLALERTDLACFEPEEESARFELCGPAEQNLCLLVGHPQEGRVGVLVNGVAIPEIFLSRERFR